MINIPLIPNQNVPIKRKKKNKPSYRLSVRPLRVGRTLLTCCVCTARAVQDLLLHAKFDVPRSVLPFFLSATPNFPYGVSRAAGNEYG